jgi:hypothetical protein
MDITLQWATYVDASNQSSLSRIWGGIHPPADDIPGRRIGAAIAADAFSQATALFEGNPPLVETVSSARLFPNPARTAQIVSIEIGRPTRSITTRVFDAQGRLVSAEERDLAPGTRFIDLELDRAASGVYFVSVEGEGFESVSKLEVLR